MQILGQDLASPSDLVICWTHDGDANTHGTGFAKKVALAYGVEIKDFFYPEIMDEMSDFVKHYKTANMHTN